MQKRGSKIRLACFTIGSMVLSQTCLLAQTTSYTDSMGTTHYHGDVQGESRTTSDGITHYYIDKGELPPPKIDAPKLLEDDDGYDKQQRDDRDDN